MQDQDQRVSLAPTFKLMKVRSLLAMKAGLHTSRAEPSIIQRVESSAANIRERKESENTTTKSWDASIS